MADESTTELPLDAISMRALRSFIVTTFGSSLLAGVVPAAEPFNWSPQVDDPTNEESSRLKINAFVT